MDSTGHRSAKRWWVTTAGQNPQGPMSATELAAGIESGEIVTSALVCAVGGSAWVALTDVAEFEMVLGPRDVGIRDGSGPGLAEFDELPEHTIVGRPAFDSLPGVEESESDGDDMPTLRPAAPPDD